jgi:diacylglycerol kinase family enzyme
MWHGVNLKVTADNLQTNGHYLLALISNIHLYAGGLAKVSPFALLDDNAMDLWLFEGDTFGEIIQMAWDMYSGRHVDSVKVQNIPFRNLRLESDSRLYVQVDAEPLPHNAHSLEINVISKGLKMLIPEGAPRELFRKNGSF